MVQGSGGEYFVGAGSGLEDRLSAHTPDWAPNVLHLRFPIQEDAPAIKTGKPGTKEENIAAEF